MEEKQTLLAKLRSAKEAQGLSYQDITDMTEKNGEAVSFSTVRRVLHPDAKIEEFRYDTSVRPIVRAVLGLDEETAQPETADPEQAEQYYTTIEAMKAVIDFKHEQYMEQSAEIERMRAELATARSHEVTAVEKAEADAQKKIDYLKKIIDDLQVASKWYKKLIFAMGVFCCLALVGIILDLAIGSFGWIRY